MSAKHRRTATAGLAIGLSLTVVALVAIFGARAETSSVGRPAASSLAATSSAATTSPPQSSSTITSPAPAAPSTTASVPSKDASITAAVADQIVAPVKVSIPSLGISAAVVPVGVQADGQLQIPENVAAVGWYRFGPAPRSASGSTVLAGHVDSAEQGAGAFFGLAKLAPGDAVAVRLANGKDVRYQVVAREVFAKSEVPWSRVFDRGGKPRLVLVTCGGAFKQSIRSYVDNILITAVPVGASK